MSLNMVKLFKDVPLGQIPLVAANVAGTRFEKKSLAEIRTSEGDYYDFISHVIKVLSTR